MLCLERMNEIRRLQCYAKVQWLFLVLRILAVSWMVLPYIDKHVRISWTYMYLVFRVLSQVFFMLVVIVISVLWSNAQKYAYVTQLFVTDNDGENGMAEDPPSAAEKSSDNNSNFENEL